VLKYLYILIFFSLNPIIGLAQIPAAGLIAHWNFNGNANDVSGNGLNGTMNNVTSVAGKSGLPNTALYFNGTASSNVTVPYNPAMNVTALSICITFLATTHNKTTCQGNRMFERFGNPGNYFFEFTDNTFDSSCSSFDTNRYCLQGAYNNLGSPWWNVWQTTNTIHTGTWYCAVMTFNGSAYKIYLNGTLIKTVTLTFGSLGSNTSGIIMGKNNGGIYYFNGIMDDVALYNRALADTEVAAYCNAAYQMPDTSVSISNAISKTRICTGDTIHISYQVTNPFKTGNVFTAQLSDASGNFATPINIGSVVSTTGGIIVGTIPTSIPFGTGYRIRVVGSNPVKISNDNGVNLTISASITVSLGNDTILCNNYSGIVLDPHYTGGTYLWQDGSTTNTYNAKQTGKYYVLVKSPFDCAASDTMNLKMSYVVVDLGNDTVLCNQKNGITLDPHYSGGTYLWQNSSTANTFNTKESGKYYVAVTSPDGCIGSDTINVTMRYASVELGADTILCFGHSLLLSVPDTFDTYKWSTGNAGSSVTVNSGGKYWISAGKAGCANSDSINITLYDPYFDLGNDTTLCLDETLLLSAKSIAGSSYTWQDGSAFDNYSVKQPGVYSVKATNICGIFADSIKVDYEDCVCNPAVPSAFTPNNDGLNDAVGPFINCRVDAYQFIVANRWGNIVFNSGVPGAKWDGTYKGKPQEVGAYYYYMFLRGPQKKEYILRGNITLLR
jgi:gliding motility-associated-like protein